MVICNHVERELSDPLSSGQFAADRVTVSLRLAVGLAIGTDVNAVAAAEGEKLWTSRGRTHQNSAEEEEEPR